MRTQHAAAIRRPTALGLRQTQSPRRLWCSSDQEGAGVNNGIKALYAAFMIMFALAALLLAITYP